MRRAVMLGFGWVVGCNPNLENTSAPPGDPVAFMPFAHLAAIGTYAGPDAKLIDIEAVGVPASGKIALGTTSGQARYKFSAKDDQGRYVDVTIRIVKPHDTLVSHGDINANTRKRHLGMQREPAPYNRWGAAPTTAPPPKCDIAELWKQAIAAGAPSTAMATVAYDALGYELRIQGKHRRFDHDCKLVSPGK